nr:unnamed protein product [Callosobruchus chinensis]
MTCKLRSARLSRWIIFIQEFNFRIQYCSGADKMADALSRYPLKDRMVSTPDICTNVQISLIKLTSDFSGLKKHFGTLRRDQLEEIWIKDKIEFLEMIKLDARIFTPGELKIYEWFVLYEGLLFKRGDTRNKGYKLCVPNSQVKELVLAHHRSMGHFCKTKTYVYMCQSFYWPRMRHIRQLVAACDLCQKAKPSPISMAELDPILLEKPGQLVCGDLIGPLPEGRGGVIQLFVLVDAFTKFVKLYAIRRATAKTLVKRLFNDYIPSVQKPVCILSDNGTQFTSHIWKKQLTEAGIKYKFISCYFPQGNLTERYNREIERMLKTYCYEKHTTWPNKLSMVEECLNSAINLSTGYSPRYLQFGTIQLNPVQNFIKFPETRGVVICC